MKNFKELEAICDLIIDNNMPKQHVLVMNKEEYNDTRIMLKTIGSKGVSTTVVPNTNITCDILIYAGITFYIVNTEV